MHCGGVSKLILIFIGDTYFQPLSSDPFIPSYNQPVILRFLLAVGSDGISNGITYESLVAFYDNSTENSGGQFSPRPSEASLQVFILELGIAASNLTGNYTVCMYSNF